MEIRQAPFTYAKSGGPSRDWKEIKVWDKTAQRIIENAHEVDCVDGWVKVYCPRRLTDNPEEIPTETIHGDYMLIWDE